MARPRDAAALQWYVAPEPLRTRGAATGLTGIPKFTTLFWTWGVAALAVYVVASLVNSTYGRGFIAVHDDEVAAGAMGINPTKFKIVVRNAASTLRFGSRMSSSNRSEPRMPMPSRFGPTLPPCPAS